MRIRFHVSVGQRSAQQAAAIALMCTAKGTPSTDGTRHQSQDGQNARPHDSGIAASECRWGHRI